MVKLRQIKRNGDSITCNAFVEDCAEPVKLIFNILDGSIQNSPLPKGYEWCTAHIRHAGAHLEQMAKAAEIPEQRNIMWC